MTDAALKLKIFRMIDCQEGQTLTDLYELILQRLYELENEPKHLAIKIEEAFQEFNLEIDNLQHI